MRSFVNPDIFLEVGQGGKGKPKLKGVISRTIQAFRKHKVGPKTFRQHAVKSAEKLTHQHGKKCINVVLGVVVYEM